MLVCRKEPEGKIYSTEMYIERSNEIEIPEVISSNTNLNNVKDTLNEIFSMSFLEIKSNSENNTGFTSRPSYRD